MIKKFHFINIFPYSGSFALLLLVLALALFKIKGLHYGLDFTGGVELHLSFSQKHSLQELRSFLAQDYEEVFVQEISHPEKFHVMVKLPTEDITSLTETVQKKLSEYFKDTVIIEKSDLVGPKAGESLKKTGFNAMFFALFFIMIYIALRFDLVHGPAVVLALLHDVFLLFGFFALLNYEFTLQTLAAVLTVIGYSVNNTVIIFDRIRELSSSSLSLRDMLSTAIHQTLSRTLLTSFTTLLVTITMAIMTTGSLKEFFVIISLGVIGGTFSSIFLAAPFIYYTKPYLEKLRMLILGE